MAVSPSFPVTVTNPKFLNSQLYKCQIILTHDDFKPANKLGNISISLADVIEQDVEDNLVMLIFHDVPLTARNILEDPELKSAVKAFS
ncbi:hypothetical protein Fmac_020021 [Flemingia macrophylla]|uniref:Uncharacterized protein n=1 Tax=Flemingia macrophylla TaxID=520843 RepID=A0ABD1M9I9_9FABA